MTDRKFTTPTEFPAEYVTHTQRKAVITKEWVDGDGNNIFVGHIVKADGDTKRQTWRMDGISRTSDANDLHDLPKKQVRWANDYGDNFPGMWRDSRETANNYIGNRRIAVIRREWIEGQPPQYFTEKV